MQHAFGQGRPFSLGAEEELMLVEPETGALEPAAERVLARMAAHANAGAAGHEAYAAELELRSQPCATPAEVVAALAALRAAARDAGATLLGAGLHPAGELGDARLVDSERYRRVGERMRGLMARTPECALHVHVGMPDAQACVRAFNGMRVHLPLLTGLAANSPWWFARDSGFASARWTLVRAYPGRGVPPPLRDLDDYAAAIDATMLAAEAEDYTWLWWDVRPHPRLGTLELREMDAQTSLDDVAALVALVQALARAEAERPTPAPRDEAIAWSQFRAARDGVEAEIVHDGALRPLREVAREQLVRLRPYARELGSDAELASVERLLQAGGGAGGQRAAHTRGAMAELLGWLVEQTGGPARRAA